MATNFDPVARLYRYLEYAAFGRALWRRRIAYLGCLSQSRCVLMAGEGDGRFLNAFLTANPRATVDYFDSSARMLALARRRCAGHGSRVRFVQADLLCLPQPLRPYYDALVTHFFLDCFTDTELASLVPALAASALPNARWIVSEFQETGPVARILLRGLYGFFSCTTGLQPARLPQYRHALRQAGFALRQTQRARAGLLTSELWTRTRSDDPDPDATEMDPVFQMQDLVCASGFEPSHFEPSKVRDAEACAP